MLSCRRIVQVVSRNSSCFSTLQKGEDMLQSFVPSRRSHPHHASAAAFVDVDVYNAWIRQVRDAEQTFSSETNMLSQRFQVMAEVAVSKVFPAGFAWQGASLLADNLGMSADSLSFALATGIGNGLGLLTGHTLFMVIKAEHALAVTGEDSIDIGSEVQTGMLLGSAAFCSGTV